MTRDEAKEEIKSRWKELYPTSKDGKGIICPICKHGKNGDGIIENPKARNKYALSCFGCEFRGDVLDLIQQDRGIDLYEAINEAAAELHIIFTGNNNASEATQSHKKKEVNKVNDTINTAATAATDEAEQIVDYTSYYKECRNNLVRGSESNPNKAAIDYLTNRGLSIETIGKVNIGYDANWVSPTVIKKFREQGNDYTPPATKRIIIPCGKNSYVARAMDEEATIQKMNETGGGEVGIFNKKILNSEVNYIFVTEGAFDALSIIEAGGNAIATNSANNADKLIKELGKSPSKSVFILCYDNDEKGKKATQVLKDGLGRLNIAYTVADICGEYKDPNEALTGNREEFIKAVKEAEKRASKKIDNVSNYIEFLMDADIEKLKAAREIKTGFEELDHKSGGLYAGLYVVAAISSLGKTTFTHQIADNLAAAGNDVLFFSMEQSRLELVSKSIARQTALNNIETAVSSLDIRKGLKNDAIITAATDYKNRVADRLSIIEGNFNCNISFIGEYVRSYINRTNCKPIVVIDYLQILQPAEEQKHSTTKETVDNTVTELKRLSREQGITVFIISSVNRANYMTPIDFESLKESGGIEYTADVIWGLQLQCLEEDIFNKSDKIKDKRERIRQAKAEIPRKIELTCLKNRYGISSFNCSFEYYPNYDLFREVTLDINDNPFIKKEINDNEKNGNNKRVDPRKTRK